MKIPSIPIVVVAGPTATGKSQIALELAKEFNGFIINADSRQVYKELSIGTAKPTFPDFQNGIGVIDGIEHHLYGHVSIHKDYNLNDYQSEVMNILYSKEDSNQVGFLVGGTGLYIDCVVNNFILDPQKSYTPGSISRSGLDTLSVAELHAQIPSQTLEVMNDSDRNNPRRLIRVIETGSSLSREKGDPLTNIYLVLDIDKDELLSRVDLRVDQMFEDGLVAEAESVKAEILSQNNKALDTIGYREFYEYFMNNHTLDETKELIKTHTRQYVKKQYTWYKKSSASIKVKNYSEAFNEVQKFLKTV